MVHFALQKAVKYALKRIDYVNPANKLVNKYAPPGYRKSLFKLVKASELFIGGKSAYDIYLFMQADDSPGNGVQTQRPRNPPRKSYQTRRRFPVRNPAEYCRRYYSDKQR